MYRTNYFIISFWAIIAFVMLCSLTANAQTEKELLKLENLKKKISNAEKKIIDANSRIEQADSLLSYGEERINIAELRFAEIHTEQKNLEKSYKKEYKRIRKLTRSKDEATADRAEDDLKVLEKQFNTNIKAYRDEIKALTRQAAKGESDIARGLDRQRAGYKKLRDAEKALDEAREKYNMFAASITGK